MRRPLGVLALVLSLLGAALAVVAETTAPQVSGAAVVDRIESFGAAPDHGSPDVAPNHRPVGMAPAANGGYWVLTSDGGVQTFGGARFHGSAAPHLSAPAVGIAANRDHTGYWVASVDGGVYSFGQAPFRGSLGGQRLAAAIVGIASAPDGNGYWLAAADGGVFGFGSARYAGGLAGTRLTAPIVGIASAHEGNGYWLAAADGGVFSFGSARFHGSAGDIALVQPITGIAATHTGGGYWLAAADGGVFTYGDAVFHGAPGAGYEPVTAIANLGRRGYWLLRAPQPPAPPLPSGSGSGRRIVYSNPQQRVWLVEADGRVHRSYLVSGKYRTPAAGTYSVYSKSRRAYAGHDGIEMDNMVRFARSTRSGIPIGFHGIPRQNGRPMQTEDDLGGFRSAGCVRQSDPDAAYLYDWAPIGTTVVVLH
jgi:hypothetical protein